MLILLFVFAFEKCAEATEASLPMQSGNMNLSQDICLKGIIFYDNVIETFLPLFPLIVLYCYIVLIPSELDSNLLCIVGST